MSLSKPLANITGVGPGTAANSEATTAKINSTSRDTLSISTDCSDSANVPLAAAVFNSSGRFVRKPFLELKKEEEAVSGFKRCLSILCVLAQLLAREFGLKGVHVLHVIINEGINSTKKYQFKDEYAKLGPDSLHRHWHTEPWTMFGFKLDLRLYVERC
ncbi:hypothetical protein BJX61DRAFT_535740 [Aspergillus egyptiacus]|nr:hypothetical protein BJX61DRAFT_535740 [Aspergillus egyptiacus]